MTPVSVCNQVTRSVIVIPLKLKGMSRHRYSSPPHPASQHFVRLPTAPSTQDQDPNFSEPSLHVSSAVPTGIDKVSFPVGNCYFCEGEVQEQCYCPEVRRCHSWGCPLPRECVEICV